MNLSEKLFFQSVKLVPGGVHSPVRAFSGLDRAPVFFERGEGAKLYDVEGRDFIDFCMSFGPLILGHSDPDVRGAIVEQVEKGWSYGTCEPWSLKLVDFLLERLPMIEQIRFVNSGTEAVMTALRLARGYTGREKIVKFSGCYHGHVDSMLIRAGSGLTVQSEASSSGVPRSVSQDTLVLELGDEQGLKKIFERYPEDIAAVIIEPLPANNGLLIQDSNFLERLRMVTQERSCLLIFDEVISGFRLGFEGMMGKVGIVPDLITYGKIIGGGLPVGAVAGKRTVMESLAPVGDVYQAGTLSANPLAMAAGLATLKKLTPDFYKRLDFLSRSIIDLLRKKLGKAFPRLNIVGQGSLFGFTVEQEEFPSLFEYLFSRGIYIAPSPSEVGFISSAHDESILEELERRLES